MNILSDHQIELCYLFASSDKEERFNDTNRQLIENNLPIINDMFGLLECKKHQQIEAGDHYILIGEVINIKKNDTKPLLYNNRNVQPVIEQYNY
ncbi:flavin reductase family protein [Pseudogracilibacillus sp. SO30301A]|uniref:flavin reductase family protein n=1 Tax=Pseudogracilibacillus sp. SO30301A TaxID=3098291 RepID=UPI00300DE5B1